SLSSSDSAVTVPGSVTVPAGASSAGFTATGSAVTTSQTATLTASAGGVTKSYALQLSPSSPALTLQSTSVSFGDVTLNTPATQTVTLTSSGTAPLTISAGTVTGTGFSISEVSFPVTLNPGQTATLSIEFDPTATGSATGTVTLTDNASPGTATIALSGTGQAASYEVDLTWDAPGSSSDPVVGYNVYRATGSSSSYQLLNTSVNTPASYTDTTVQDGTAYTYYVVSVDASGNRSSPSNTWSVTIP
ncbi:MAG: choice-of-anchor D domain-containing protein, partial [Silvibacterium sp.]